MLLGKETVQNYLNKLAYSTPIAERVDMLLGGTNTDVYFVSIENGDDIVARKASASQIDTFRRTHELESWIAKHATPGFGTPTPYIFIDENPYFITKEKDQQFLISFQPFLGQPLKYSDKNMSAFTPELAERFAVSVEKWLEAANTKNDEGKSFEQAYAEKYGIENFKHENPYPVKNYDKITERSLDTLMEVDPRYYAKYNGDFRRISHSAKNNYKELGKTFDEIIINWDQCIDNSKMMDDTKNFVVFDNAESGRGYEAIECAMAIMFSCIDIENGKGKLNSESARAFLNAAQEARGKKFSPEEQEAIFSHGAELAVARWSTRRLEHQSNLWEQYRSKVGDRYNYEEAIEDFKKERDGGRFRGLDDLHSALKEFTSFKATGNYKQLFMDDLELENFRGNRPPLG